MSLLKKRKQNKKAVAYQKKKSRFLSSFKFLIKIGMACLVSFLLWQAYSNHNIWLKWVSEPSILPNIETFQFSENTLQNIPSGKRKLIADIISSKLDKPYSSLNSLSVTLQKAGGFGMVHLSLVNYNHLIVTLKERKAIARISLGKDFLLSHEGEIYRMETMSTFSKLPFIIIPTSKKERLHKKGGGTYQVSHQKRKLIGEAMALVRDMSTLKFHIKQAKFVPYRGFRVELTGKDLPVLELGRAPFDKKLNRFISIYSEAISKGKRLEKVELDYAGKAFIRSRT